MSNRTRIRDSLLGAFIVVLAALSTSVVAGQEQKANPLQDSESWQNLRDDLAGEHRVLNGSALFDVETPYRAEDAALVPVRIKAREGSPAITAAKIVIDENPAPLAADFSFGKSMAPLDFETRIRVDRYSNVRVLSQIDDNLYMNGGFVRASGGCSAPATKDMDSALADLGRMKLRLYEDQNDDGVNAEHIRRNAQLMIRHPNYSGLQRNQITQLFIPAFFIHRLELYQGEELLFSMTGGISISENPVFRFDYKDDGSEHFRAVAIDTDGNRFEASFDKSSGEQNI